MQSNISNDQKAKLDAGKLRYDLIPAECLEELARVYTLGESKYGPNTWQKVESKRYEAALFRHLQAWRKGKKINMEDGVLLRHMGQVAWNAFALLWKELEDEKIARTI